MARTETDLQRARRLRRSADIRVLITWTLYRNQFGESPETLTVRLSDRSYHDPDAGAEWAPLILGYGQAVSRGAERGPTGSPDSFEFTLAPRPVPGTDAARLLDLLRRGRKTDGYDAGMGRVVVELLDDGLPYSEAFKLGGPWVVDDIRPAEDGPVTVRLASEDAVLDVQAEALVPALVHAGDAVPAWLTGKVWVRDVRWGGISFGAYEMPSPSENMNPRWDDNSRHTSGTAVPSGQGIDLYDGFVWYIFWDPAIFTGATLRFISSGSYVVRNMSYDNINDGSVPGGLVGRQATLQIYHQPPPTDFADIDEALWTSLPTPGALLDEITLDAPMVVPGFPVEVYDWPEALDYTLNVAGKAGLLFKLSTWGVDFGHHAEPVNEHPTVQESIAFGMEVS